MQPKFKFFIWSVFGEGSQIEEDNQNLEAILVNLYGAENVFVGNTNIFYDVTTEHDSDHIFFFCLHGEEKFNRLRSWTWKDREKIIFYNWDRDLSRLESNIEYWSIKHNEEQQALVLA